MNNKPDKKEDKEDCGESLECAHEKLHKSISSASPELEDENGECPSCISIEHELAARPNEVPKDLEPE
ncbi:MAG: hypothetical protein ACSHX6_03355 [Akkermansiaceae bacterium]